MTEITKADLDQLEKNILAGVEPMANEINGIKLTLYGKDGRAGVVADVNNIKNSGKWIKALAGGGLISGVSGWFKEFIK